MERGEGGEREMKSNEVNVMKNMTKVNETLGARDNVFVDKTRC